MTENKNNTETMKSMTMRELYKRGLWKTCSSLRENSSGFYFVTLLNKQGKAANLYLGKKSSSLIKDNFKAGDNIIQWLGEASIVETANKEGETRFKISGNGNSNYSSEASIQEIFGNSLEEQDFSIENFKKEFESQVAVQTQENIEA
jgi:hypothetical protein